MTDATGAETAPNRLPNQFVIIGEIVKAIGLKGEVKLYPLLNFHTALLLSDYLVWGDGVPVALIKQRPAGSCIALKLRDVDDRDAAEVMVGRELGFMSHSYLAADFPKPDGGLPFRWLGREVQTTTGQKIGTVTEVRVAGAGHMLVVPDPEQAAREIMIPAVAPILAPEDELSGVLVIDPPEGLFDVQRG